jgi:hypothetical protein
VQQLPAGQTTCTNTPTATAALAAASGRQLTANTQTAALLFGLQADTIDFRQLTAGHSVHHRLHDAARPEHTKQSTHLWAHVNVAAAGC